MLTGSVIDAPFAELSASYAGAFGRSSPRALTAESPAIVVLVVASAAGFRISLWIVGAALTVHGVFDLLHGRLIDIPGVPDWWPGFCLAYDLAAAAYLAWLLSRSGVRAAH